MAEIVINVVIVNYNTSKDIIALIESFPALSSSTSIHFIILDNASNAENVAKIRQLSATDNRIALIESSTNLGFGAGVNRAVESIKGNPNDYVWIINPDTLLVGEAYNPLVKSLKDGYDVVSPLILNDDGESIWFAGGSVDLKRGINIHEYHGKDLAETPLGLSNFNTSFMTGAAPMMTMKTWTDIGGFEEDLFLYWEDVSWTLQALQKQKKMAVVPTAKILHSQGAASGSGSGASAVFYYYVQRNRLVVCGRYRPKVALLLGSGIITTAKLTLSPLLKEKDKQLKKFIAGFKGIIDGVKDVTGSAEI